MNDPELTLEQNMSCVLDVSPGFSNLKVKYAEQLKQNLILAALYFKEKQDFSDDEIMNAVSSLMEELADDSSLLLQAMSSKFKDHAREMLKDFLA